MGLDGSQLLKGTLDVALLAMLAEGPNYGHGLFSGLVEAGLPGVADASVYGALRRLEVDGMLASELVDAGTGPARKYYRLTPEGCATRHDAIQAWAELAKAMQRIVRGKR